MRVRPFQRTSQHVIAACFISAVAPSSHAYDRLRTDYGKSVRWAELPLRLYAESLPGEPARARAALERALGAWSAPPCTALRFELVSAAGDSVVTILSSQGDWRHGAHIAAHTKVASDKATGRASTAAIELNGAHFFSSSDVPAPGALDLETLLTHEIGHLIGLAHSRERGAIMRAGVKPGDVRRGLTDDDVAGLCALYPR